MNTCHIIKAVIRNYYSRSTCMPNYTPDGWFENDVCEVTEAGYWREYEVKVSRADFKADSRKRRWVSAERDSKTKYDLLASGTIKGPSRFTYVMPKGLIQLDELPPFAGLIEARDSGNGFVILTQVKAAPKIHSEKVKDGFLEQMQTSAYWRFLRSTIDTSSTELTDAAATRVLDILSPSKRASHV
jgi:hypothetical protein